MTTQHTVRDGEVLLLSSERQLVGSNYDLDVVGRRNIVGLEAGVASIVGALEGAAIVKQYPNVKIVEGKTGVIPVRFRGEDDQGRAKFVGMEPVPSRQSQVEELMKNENLGPVSLANSVFKLVEAGWDRDRAIAWGKDQRALAIGIGTARSEPWEAEVQKLLSS